MDPLRDNKNSDPALFDGQLSLLDLISLEDLQQLQDTLADINQVASVITDPSGNPLTMPSNEMPICSMVRQVEPGVDDCEEIIATVEAEVKVHRQPVCKNCHSFSIIKAAVPIFIDAHHLANWWLSQRCGPPPSEEKLVAYAERIGAAPEELLKEFDRMPEGDPEGFKNILRWTDKLTHRIVQMGYQNLTLSRDLSKLHHMEGEFNKHRSEVDALVQERTEALTSVNTRLQLEVMERDLVEEQIARKSDLLDALNRIFKQALSSKGEIDLPRTFLNAAQNLTGSSFGLLVEYKDQGWQVAASSQPAIEASETQGSDTDLANHFEIKGIWKDLVEGGTPITIPSVDDQTEWRPLPKGYPRVVSLLAIPLKSALKTSGFIALANNKEGYAPVDQSDVETLAKAFIEALSRRRKERDRSHNQLRLHLAMESANEGLWDYSPKQDQIYYSVHWFTMLGYYAEEFPQTLETWRTLVHPDDLPIIEGALNKLAGGNEEVFNVEIRMLSRAGKWCWIQVRGKSVERDIDGDVSRIVGTLMDISKFKQAEVALQKANDELIRLAALDDLTQIANRRRFDDRLTQEWRRAQRDQQFLAVIICDIDYFKNYNDTYGHLKGDDTLFAVAQAINATLKRPMDLVARYGGEEFAMVLPATGIAGAKRVANEVKAAIDDLAIEHKGSLVSKYITLSFGVAALVPLVDLKPKELIATADQVLYRAKEMGRDQIVTAPPEDFEVKDDGEAIDDAPEKEPPGDDPE